MSTLTVTIPDELKSRLEKRAKKNFMSLQELVEDIIRRSMINYKDKNTLSNQKTDDSLVNIFSRKRK